MKYIVDIHGEIEGDYEIIGKYEARPQGKWIDIDSRVSKAMCSKCNNTIITEPFGKPNFCPNCGADMRVKDELGGRE